MDWEEKYPEVTATSLLRIGSDHTPILVDTGEDRTQEGKIFRFEMAWLTQNTFREKLIEKWPKREQEKILDYWKMCIINLRQFCRGWGRNWDTETRKSKQVLIEKIKKLDNKAEQMGLSEEEWEDRYGLERSLEQIYAYEEIREKRRGNMVT